MTVQDASPYARKTRILSLVVLSVALLLTLPFRSISLDDFDSYSFALALEQYDLALQQPQPPGFPVYIAIAAIFHALWPDPILALTLLSALCGAASAWVVYQIGRQLDPQHPASALIAALLFVTLPVSWLTSGKALTDMPGVFATLLSLWLWLGWRWGSVPRMPSPLLSWWEPTRCKISPYQVGDRGGNGARISAG
jgi:uncharacterized membrane protein